ncbi:MAG TPA: hypothetical protein GXX37_09440 [Clostridiaceae bacterium]|nr:hypothetical protein [Clostridiaceae bacterium]
MRTKIYSELLEDYCNAMLGLQITDIKTDGIYGGIMCPSCSRIHGRSPDTIYPFMYMAHINKESKFLDAALKLFDWSKHVSMPDGSFINDTNSKWNGITVFSVIQLCEAIRHHGSILDPKDLMKWKDRLKGAANFLYNFLTISSSNINYAASGCAALLLSGIVLEEPNYISRSKELAYQVLEYFSENNLIFGEGKPQNGKTARGCRAIDLGYNVEESLGGLAIYGLLSNDEFVLDKITKSLEAHLEFMMPDGSWDNSWGTRNAKWTYYGSRTSDGCQIAYGLLQDRNPLFGEAVYRNTLLMKECTHEGILYGGPHYLNVGELPCIHHTFTHAKALATLLDYNRQCDLKHSELSKEETSKSEFSEKDTSQVNVKLPREAASGIKYYNEINTALVAMKDWRATITLYDWEYVKDGHASGGAITMLWNNKIGPLITASLTEYQIWEPNNMQIPRYSNHACITPRIEFRNNRTYYRNVNDTNAEMEKYESKNEIKIVVRGKLVDSNNRSPETGDINYKLAYCFKPDELITVIDINTEKEVNDIVYWMPVISKHQEKLSFVDKNNIEIYKSKAKVIVSANTEINLINGNENNRIYNLVPGFEAVPICTKVYTDKSTIIKIKLDELQGDLVSVIID